MPRILVSDMWSVPILLTDGRGSRTLADVRKRLPELSETDRLAPYWQRLAEV